MHALRRFTSSRRNRADRQHVGCRHYYDILPCLVVLLKLRRESTVRPSFRVPGGGLVILFALAGALIAAAVALFERMWSAGRIPLECYLLIGWALIGIGLLAARNWGERLAVSET